MLSMTDNLRRALRRAARVRQSETGIAHDMTALFVREAGVEKAQAIAGELREAGYHAPADMIERHIEIKREIARTFYNVASARDTYLGKGENGNH